MRRWLLPLITVSLIGCDPTEALVDADGDTYFANNPDPALVDCNDTPTAGLAIHPHAREVCDGIDNDCDGVVDGPGSIGTQSFWPDADHDGYGTYTDTPIEACSARDGLALNRLDCNDADASIFPNAPEQCNGLDDNCDNSIDEGLPTDTRWFQDIDGDGYGGVKAGTGCATDPSWVTRKGDCNDLSGTIHPDANEICNGIDDNCDDKIDDDDPLRVGGTYWYADADADSYGNALAPTQACVAPTGTVANAEDCDDSTADISPDTVWFRDADADGHGTSASYWPTRQCLRPVGYALHDDDCDDADPRLWKNKVWYADGDRDGYGYADPVATACHPAADWVDNALDCDDRDNAIHPNTTEVCDTKDNDCNGLIDDDDENVVGQQTWYGDADDDGIGLFYKVTQACFEPPAYAPILGDCDDTNPNIGADTIWYRDVDRDGWGDDADSIVDSTCTPQTGRVPRGGDCDDADYTINPDTPWFTDTDHDGVGIGHIPVARGCVPHIGLSPVGGDCNDSNPADSEGGCFSVDPQGKISLDITGDNDAARFFVRVQCTGQSSSLQEVIAYTMRAGDKNKTTTHEGTVHDYGGSCILSVSLPTNIGSNHDPSGDGFLKIDITLCDELYETAWSPTPNGAGFIAFPVPSCSGCTDPAARNFDPDAIVSEPVCYY